MLPVRLKVLSSSSCTLPEASSLLQRFLSSDACSDSLARDYVANVAQALQDSICRRAEKSGGARRKHRHFSSSSQPSSNISPSDEMQSTRSPGVLKREKLAVEHAAGKCSVIAAGDNGEPAGSAGLKAENVHKSHKKRRRHSAIVNDTETVFASTRQADDDSDPMHREKKRRKKENYGVETGHNVSESSIPDNQRSKNKETSGQLPLEKKKTKKEKQGDNVEVTETLHVNGFGSSPRLVESLVMKSITKGKRKRDAGSVEANRTSEARVGDTPMSLNKDENLGASKRKKREEHAGLLATPDKIAFIKAKEKIDAEALLVESESIDPVEKKRKKKKKRKEGLESE